MNEINEITDTNAQKFPDVQNAGAVPSQNVQTNESASHGGNKKALIYLALALIGIFVVGGLVGGAYLLGKGNKKGETSTITTSTQSSTSGEKKSCTYSSLKASDSSVSLKSKEYKDGESFQATDGCNTCTCNDGKVACTLMVCSNTTSNSTTTQSTDPYAGWKSITLPNAGYTVKVPSTWNAQEETVEYAPDHIEYRVVLTDNNNSKYYMGECIGGIGDCDRCEHGKNWTTLFTFNFLGKNTNLILSECYGDPIDPNTIDTRALAFSVDNYPTTGKTLYFGHFENDLNASFTDLQAKYSDLKKVLESMKNL